MESVTAASSAGKPGIESFPTVSTSSLKTLVRRGNRGGVLLHYRNLRGRSELGRILLKGHRRRRHQNQGEKSTRQGGALKGTPPALTHGLGRVLGIMNNSFRFQLVAQGNPDVLGRSNPLHAQFHRGIVDLAKIRRQRPAALAFIHVGKCRLRQRPFILLFKKLFELIALHFHLP